MTDPAPEPQPNPEVHHVKMRERVAMSTYSVMPEMLTECIDSLRIKVRMVADKNGITPLDDGEWLTIEVNLDGLMEEVE